MRLASLFIKMIFELPEIFIDAKQPEQVLVNLYFNAIAAMPHGGQLTV